MKLPRHVKMESGQITLCLRVLGYRKDDGPWAAHCLETDLVGYGDSFEQAMAELKELTDMQVGFAFFKNQPALLDRQAPSDIIEIYTNLVRQILQNFTVSRVTDERHRISSLPWPSNVSKSGTAFVQAQTV